MPFQENGYLVDMFLLCSLSPRTPSDAAKIARLEGISKKLSPSREVPPLPQGACSAGNGDLAQADPYLEAIRQLSSKMDGLASKADVEGVKSAMLAQTKTLISEAVDPLKSEIADIKQDVGSMEVRLAKVEERTLIGDAEVTKQLNQKIIDM